MRFITIGGIKVVKKLPILSLEAFHHRIAEDILASFVYSTKPKEMTISWQYDQDYLENKWNLL